MARYWHNANGSMTMRNQDSADQQAMVWNGEEDYLNSGNGMRIRKTCDEAGTSRINRYFGVDGSGTKIKCYYFGEQRATMCSHGVLPRL